MNRRRQTLIAFVLAVFVPLAALAAPGFGQKDRGAAGGRHILPPPGYLDLTEEQMEAARSIRESVRSELEGVREEGRALRERMRAALESDSPDATTIGQLMIDQHALRQTVKAARENGAAQFEALLDEDQLVKWENFKELRNNRRQLGRQSRGRADSAGDSI